MSNFSDFYTELVTLVSKFEDQHVQLKLEADLENNIIKIFGKEFTALIRAKNGLEDMNELAIDTAEHHPYWNLLYQCCQICSVSLEKWNDTLSEKELDEIRWSISELDNTRKKLVEKHLQSKTDNKN